MKRFWILSGSIFLTLLLLADTSAAETLEQILNPKSGKVIYVRRKKAKNKNAGTKDAPKKNIDKAIEAAAEGDTIVVAEGRYKGTFSVGLWEIDKGIKLYGGFNNEFTERDWVKHPTLLQPDADRFEKSGTKWLMYTKDHGNLDPFVVDGFIFDSGEMNPYVAGAGQPEGVETGMMKVGPGSKNPNATCIQVTGNNVVIRNNVFANCAYRGVSVMLQGKRGDQLKEKGKVEIANNVFVSNRFTAIDIRGGDREPITTPAHIHHNTILFTWSRLKDFGDMGYGIDVLKKVPFLIEDNIIALNIGPGINSQHFNENIEMYRNVFWGNKKKDLWFNPKSNTNIKITADEFEDLDYDNEENSNKMLKLPLDGPYTAGVIGASYSEKVDYNPDSEANRMRELFGLNKQGKIQSKVSMFANRYSYTKALELFGAGGAVGAQKPK